MGRTITRGCYLETGLDVLSELGYGGLKLAEVCGRLGVTTGAFYHYFDGWSAYGRELVEYWVQVRTLRVIDEVHAEPNPRRRIDILLEEALRLPYGAEAAIRVWGSIDSDIHEAVAAVDRQRFDILAESALAILHDEFQAELFASSALYLLIGCEQSTLPLNPEHVEWIARSLVERLECGGFSEAATRFETH